MNEKRRTTLLALMTGALAGAAILAVRRGVPGARKMAAGLAKPRRAETQARTYGFTEVKLS